VAVLIIAIFVNFYEGGKMVKEGDKNILCDISNILNIKRTARFAF
jgi:hypothetical protein